MNRQEQITLIRQKCIEANPEVEKEATGKAITLGLGASEWDACVRPIRLADVLLAIEAESQYGDSLYMDFDGSMEYHRVNLLAGPEPEQEMFKGTWNLRKDDLTEQSDESVAFLAYLLK